MDSDGDVDIVIKSWNQGGDPENMVAVCRILRQNYHTDQMGIIYNFHLAQDLIDDFEKS